jgi:hypothetical protein
MTVTAPKAMYTDTVVTVMASCTIQEKYSFFVYYIPKNVIITRNRKQSSVLR